MDANRLKWEAHTKWVQFTAHEQKGKTHIKVRN